MKCLICTIYGREAWTLCVGAASGTSRIAWWQEGGPVPCLCGRAVPLTLHGAAQRRRRVRRGGHAPGPRRVPPLLFSLCICPILLGPALRGGGSWSGTGAVQFWKGGRLPAWKGSGLVSEWAGSSFGRGSEPFLGRLGNTGFCGRYVGNSCRKNPAKGPFWFQKSLFGTERGISKMGVKI